MLVGCTNNEILNSVIPGNKIKVLLAVVTCTVGGAPLATGNSCCYYTSLQCKTEVELYKQGGWPGFSVIIRFIAYVMHFSIVLSYCTMLKCTVYTVSTVNVLIACVSLVWLLPRLKHLKTLTGMRCGRNSASKFVLHSVRSYTVSVTWFSRPVFSRGWLLL